MSFMKLAAERYSVRKFDPAPIPPELLEQVLEAGRIAPTACNLQPQRIFVIRTDETLQRARRCTNSHFNAPVILMVCADLPTAWKRSYDGMNAGVIDASIVTTHMMMQAAACGLGTTWVCYFDPKKLAEEFSLPATLVPVALLPIGFPAKDAAVHPNHYQRKPLAEIVTYL